MIQRHRDDPKLSARVQFSTIDILIHCSDNIYNSVLETPITWLGLPPEIILQTSEW